MDWTKVITHPLGLAGFALALVFGVFGFKSKSRERPWFLPVALTFAGIAIVGCFYLAIVQTAPKKMPSHPSKPAVPSPATQPMLPGPSLSQHPASTTVNQESSGANSPTLQGIHGNVTIINGDGRVRE